MVQEGLCIVPVLLSNFNELEYLLDGVDSYLISPLHKEVFVLIFVHCENLLSNILLTC